MKRNSDDVDDDNKFKKRKAGMTLGPFCVFPDGKESYTNVHEVLLEQRKKCNKAALKVPPAIQQAAAAKKMVYDGNDADSIGTFDADSPKKAVDIRLNPDGAIPMSDLLRNLQASGFIAVSTPNEEVSSNHLVFIFGNTLPTHPC